MPHPPLEPIDQELFGDRVRHVPLLDGVDRALRRVYGLGGLAAAAVAVITPIALAPRVELDALQLTLVGGATLLLSLGLVRVWARAAARRLRRRVGDYCLEHEVSQQSLAELVEQRADRWPFALAALEPEEANSGGGLTSGGQAADIEL